MTGFDNLSPDVLAAVTDGTRRQEKRELTKDERDALRKLREEQEAQDKARAAKAEYDSQRTRANYDLPRWVIAEVKRVADDYHVSASGIAALLLVAGLEALRDGGLEIETRICDSPRFEREVILPERE